MYSGGNGTSLLYYIKYAEGSTEKGPVIVAKGVTETGEESEQTIRIKDIKPFSATVVEMHALETQSDVEKGGWLDSLPLDTGSMGINDRGNFPDMYQKEIQQMARLERYDLTKRFVLNRRTYSDFINLK
ncbi:hypothetical protein [Oscillibacter sp.]|uniref:hypothetical protein n=1 Tax=Oscillibacter sp. TaxID=1945593 RepID=UPI00289AA0A8|nr:hypothetical protein [Oscillibacter sp.]